jgi:hypothetical protein
MKIKLKHVHKIEKDKFNIYKQVKKILNELSLLNDYKKLKEEKIITYPNGYILKIVKIGRKNPYYHIYDNEGNLIFWYYHEYNWSLNVFDDKKENIYFEGNDYYRVKKSDENGNELYRKNERFCLKCKKNLPYDCVCEKDTRIKEKNNGVL